MHARARKIGFGLITMILTWQLIRMYWYSHLEQQILNLKRDEIYGFRNDPEYFSFNVIAGMYQFIYKKARKRKIWKYIHYLSYLNVLPLGSMNDIINAFLRLLFYSVTFIVSIAMAFLFIP